MSGLVAAFRKSVLLMVSCLHPGPQKIPSLSRVKSSSSSAATVPPAAVTAAPAAEVAEVEVPAVVAPGAWTLVACNFYQVFYLYWSVTEVVLTFFFRPPLEVIVDPLSDD